MVQSNYKRKEGIKYIDIVYMFDGGMRNSDSIEVIREYFDRDDSDECIREGRYLLFLLDCFLRLPPGLMDFVVDLLKRCGERDKLYHRYSMEELRFVGLLLWPMRNARTVSEGCKRLKKPEKTKAFVEAYWDFMESISNRKLYY